MPNSPPSPLRLLAGTRAPGETGKAVQACNDWLRLGPGRTLRVLLARYRKTPQNPPPTASLETLEGWSKTYGWAARAEAYDSVAEEVKNVERLAVLRRGLALDYKRLQRLYRLAATLEAQLYADGTLVNGDSGSPYLWLPDVKVVNKEQVDIMRFNGALVEQLRGVYADIARETGGRAQKVDATVRGDPTAPLIREVVIQLQRTVEDAPPDGE